MKNYFICKHEIVSSCQFFAPHAEKSIEKKLTISDPFVSRFLKPKKCALLWVATLEILATGSHCVGAQSHSRFLVIPRYNYDDLAFYRLDTVYTLHK